MFRILTALILSLFMAVSIIGCSSIAIKGDNAMPNKNLQLTIKSDKEIYHVGDQIKISYTVTNMSGEPGYFINYNDVYAIHWLNIFDLNLTQMKGITQIIYDRSKYLEKEAYILLNPKEPKEIEIIGIVKRSTFYKHGRTPIESLGIDFVNSATLLSKPGIYFIEGKYLPKTSDVAEGKEKYGLDNVWMANLRSNRIKIEIVE